MTPADDTALFAEVKRSAALHEENESLKRKAISEFQNVQQLQQNILTEHGNLKKEEDLLLEESKKGPHLRKSLQELRDSIQGLQTYLLQIQEASTKLAEQASSRNVAFDDLKAENEMMQLQMSDLEDQLHRIAEEKKLLNLERKTAEEDLRKQRAANLDVVISLQQECDGLTQEIKFINNEIRRNKSHYSQDINREKNEIGKKEILSKLASTTIVEKPLTQKHRQSPRKGKPLVEPSKSKYVALEDIDQLIESLVNSKLHGIEDIVRAQVQQRFQYLEKEIYVSSIPYPVYRGVATRPLENDIETRIELINQLAGISDVKESAFRPAVSAPTTSSAASTTIGEATATTEAVKTNKEEISGSVEICVSESKPQNDIGKKSASRDITPTTTPSLTPDRMQEKQQRNKIKQLATQNPIPRAPEEPKSSRKPISKARNIISNNRGKT